MFHFAHGKGQKMCQVDCHVSISVTACEAIANLVMCSTLHDSTWLLQYDNALFLVAKVIISFKKPLHRFLLTRLSPQQLVWDLRYIRGYC